MLSRDLSNLPAAKIKESLDLNPDAKIELARRTLICDGAGEIPDDIVINLAKKEVLNNADHPVFNYVLAKHALLNHDQQMAERYFYNAATGSISQNPYAIKFQQSCMSESALALGRISKRAGLVIESAVWIARAISMQIDLPDKLAEYLDDALRYGPVEPDVTVQNSKLPAKYIHHHEPLNSTWCLHNCMLLHLFLSNSDLSFYKESHWYQGWGADTRNYLDQFVASSKNDTKKELLATDSWIASIISWALKEDEYNYYDYIKCCQKNKLLSEDVCIVLLQKFLESASDPVLLSHVNMEMYLYFSSSESKESLAKYLDKIPAEFYAKYAEKYGFFKAISDDHKFQMFSDLYEKKKYSEALVLLRMIQHVTVCDESIFRFFKEYPLKELSIFDLKFKFDLYQKMLSANMNSVELQKTAKPELLIENQLKTIVDYCLSQITLYFDEREERRQKNLFRFFLSDYFFDETRKRNQFHKELKSYANEDQEGFLGLSNLELQKERARILILKIKNGIEVFPYGIISNHMCDKLIQIHLILRFVTECLRKKGDTVSELIDFSEQDLQQKLQVEVNENAKKYGNQDSYIATALTVAFSKMGYND